MVGIFNSINKHTDLRLRLPKYQCRVKPGVHDLTIIQIQNYLAPRDCKSETNSNTNYRRIRRMGKVMFHRCVSAHRGVPQSLVPCLVQNPFRDVPQSLIPGPFKGYTNLTCSPGQDMVLSGSIGGTPWTRYTMNRICTGCLPLVVMQGDFLVKKCF